MTVYRGIGGVEAAVGMGLEAPASSFTIGTLGPVPDCLLTAAGEPVWFSLLGVLVTGRREGDSLAVNSKDREELAAAELDRIGATGDVATATGRSIAVGVPAEAGAAAVREERGEAAAFMADRTIVTD
jgi:hypothetical protein